MTFSTRCAGFTLLPVILAMSIVGAVAFLLNRDNGLNAHAITRQTEMERARYAAEAGLQAANFAVQAAGCTGIYPTSATPLSNPNFGGASYAAYSMAATGSPVTLVSTGSYNGASVTLTRANVYVYRPSRTTVVQPGSAAGLDTQVNMEFPDRNYGGEAIIRLFTGKYQSLIKFDLSGFPVGTRVVPWFDSASGTLKAGATLSLYQSQGGSSAPAFVNVQLITRSWVEGTQLGESPAKGATWKTYDGVNAWPSPGVGYATGPVATIAHTTALGWKDWDVTNGVAGWMSGVYPNHGFWLVDSGGNIGDTYYVSSEGGAATQRPKLTLNYLQPCGTGETVSIALGADAYLKSNEQTRNFGGATVMDVNDGSPERRVLLYFNAASIPPGSVIKSATLRLYCSRITSPTNQKKTINAYYVMQPWIEGTMTGTGTANGTTWNTRDGLVNWSSPGGDAYWSYVLATAREEASGTAPLPGAFREGWVTFDLTAMTQWWVDGLYANNGILVRSQASDLIEFDARESTGGKAPQLVVVFQ